MSDAWHQATIKSFEHVPVADSTGLLRVAARSPSRASVDAPRPTLIADDGRSVVRFAAIPAPADGDGIVRAAYPVGAEVVTPETVFSLELADGFALALPDPTPGAARLRRTGADGAPPVAPTPGERREALPAKLTALSAELGRARARILRLHLGAAQTRGELQAVRDLVGLSPAPATEPDRADLEQRLTEATSRAETAVLELAGERDRAQDLEERATAAEAERQRARSRLAELETWSGELERRLSETTTQLAEAHTQLELDAAQRAVPPPDGADPLEEIRRGATADAHDRAARDLASYGSS